MFNVFSVLKRKVLVKRIFDDAKFVKIFDVHKLFAQKIWNVYKFSKTKSQNIESQMITIFEKSKSFPKRKICEN